MGPQQIRAPCFLDPPQSHHTFPSSFKAPTVHVGILASNKLYPQLGVAQASQPCKKAMPDIACHITRPRSET